MRNADWDYDLGMKTRVQVRLDSDSQAALERLVRRLGWSPSRVVRESLRLMARHYSAAPHRKVIGVGKFESRVSDLGSDKKHLEGLGR